MDLIKIGHFLAGLRHEYNYTQEQLGEILGVSAFSVKEKVVFYKKKWLREHFAFIVIGIATLLVIFAFGIIKDNGAWIVLKKKQYFL